ncbi:MAG TPA: substrate-binding domain-containing protein [Abditibacterium sp.]|jgi:iron(III) transport system substrate-binding protein
MDQEKKIRFLRAALYFSFGAFVVLWSLLLMGGCTPQNGEKAATKSNRVVLYCSVDDVYAKPLIQKLEAQTGLQIDALFDTEATKTAGLANRIRAERNRPRADVFWSSALLQTLLMSEEKLLAEYDSPSARDLPAQFRGKTWAGVGTRGHILVSSMPNGVTNKILPPTGVFGRHVPKGMSNPQFGTASDWSAALGTRIPNVLTYFEAMAKGKVRIFPGNGDVARAVGDGALRFGITDSDDFLAQKRAGKPIFLVKTTDDFVLVPGAVSVLNDAPHPENAQKLFDAIVSAQNEKALTQQMPGVFSLRHMNEKTNWQSGGVDFSFLQNAPHDPDDYTKWATTWKEIREPLNQIFASK